MLGNIAALVGIIGGILGAYRTWVGIVADRRSRTPAPQPVPVPGAAPRVPDPSAMAQPLPVPAPPYAPPPYAPAIPPVGQRARVTGSVIALIGGAVAAIAFFALPYAQSVFSNSVDVTGSTLASQLSQFLASLSGQSLSGAEQTAVNYLQIFLVLLWAGAGLAGLAAIFGGISIFIGQSRKLPNRLALAILGAGALTLIAVVGQFASLTLAAAQLPQPNGAVGTAFGIFRYGYFVVVAGATVALVGGIEQLRRPQ